MSREAFERQAAREVSARRVADGIISGAGPLPVYAEEIGGALVTFNRVQLAPSPDFGSDAAKRRTLTIAGLAKQKGGAR